VIRFLPALTIPYELIDEGMDLVAKSMAEVA
jgi:acetylornithine/succinyldiaminopimelate/putrescine aminotransferase